jgi:hypothetical protein
MDQKQIEENNILIAEFMGAIYKSSFNIPKGYLFLPWHNLTRINELKYHSDWNWLMPVVEKIESIKNSHHGYFGVYISSNSCAIQGTRFRSDKIQDPPIYFNEVVLSSKIESTYIAVVLFIKWYNENKKE